MEKPENRASDYFKELAWLLLLGNVIVGLVGVLVGKYIGDVKLVVLIYAGGAGLLTLAVLVIVICNWIFLAVSERLRRNKAGRP